MPKRVCLCGVVINLSAIPCPEGYRLASELELEKLSAMGLSNTADFLDELWRRSCRCLKCSNCGRLVVYWLEQDSVTFYKPENGEE
jgi:hypothetical protein